MPIRISDGFWPLMFLVWAFSLLYLSLTPAPPQIDGALGWDKLQHAAALGVLAFIIFNSLETYGYSAAKAGVLCFCAATLFGGLIELFQGLFTINRDADILDLAADGLGAFCVALFLFYWKR